MSEMTVHESDLTTDALKELGELKGQADSSTADFNRQAQEDADRIDNLPPEVYIRPSYPEPTRMPEWYPKIEFKNREEQFGAMAARALSEKLGFDTALMDPELFYRAAESFKNKYEDKFDLEYITRIYIELRTRGVPSFRITEADIDKAYGQVDRGLQQEATKKYQKPEEAFKEYYLSHAYRLTQAEFTLRFGHQIEAFPITPATELLDRTLMENRKASKGGAKLGAGSVQETAMQLLVESSQNDGKMAEALADIMSSQTSETTDLRDVSKLKDKALSAWQASSVLVAHDFLSTAVEGLEGIGPMLFQEILIKLAKSEDLTPEQKKLFTDRLAKQPNATVALSIQLLLRKSARSANSTTPTPVAAPQP